MGLLHPGGLEVVENDAGEVLLATTVGVVGFLGDLVPGVDEVLVLPDAEDAVGGDGLDGEGAGDPHLALVLVGAVVEVFVVGLGGDGGVDLLLAGDALLPPIGVGGLGLVGPIVVGLVGDFPLVPRLAEGGVERFA